MDDHRLVRMALEQGILSREQLEHAQREQKSLADRGVEHDLWFLVQDLGYISEEQARRLRKGVSSTTLRALEIDGYTIQGRLGSGGMGDVFRARNQAGHEVAVKLLSSRYAGNQEYQDRFTREAKATLRLHHPHIVASTGAGELGGCRYLMMELVDGPSLKARIGDRGPLNDAEARLLLAQIGDALRYAWSQGVLHRDVKPANIILGPPRAGTGEPFCAKICDFGLAKVWQRDGEPETSVHGQLTGPGLALGTPHYMSPEQASGDQDLDQRCDIYGLGASLYHALRGRTMYSGKSSAVIMYKQVTEHLDVEVLIREGHEPGLVRLLGRMLAKDRAQRVASWEELLNGTGTAAAIPVPAPPEPAPRRRHPLLVAGLAAAVVAILGCGAWLVLGGENGAARSASPATLAGVLADAALVPGRLRELRLAPGRYVGAWRLGAGHAGLVVSGSPGVELAAPAGTPALTCDPGCEDVVLAGIALVGDVAPALAVQPGARVALRGCALRGVPAARVGGRLALEGCRAEGGIDAGPQAELRLAGGRMAADSAPALLGDGARAELAGVRLAGPVRWRGGVLRLGGVVVEAPAAPIALDLERVAEARLEDVLLHGGDVALRGAASSLVRCVRVTLAAGGAGAAWSGPADPAWIWEAVRVEAPAAGLPGVDGAGSGADAARLPPP